jgi:RNA polymerase sigma-70 factor (ECF subfamily)
VPKRLASVAGAGGGELERRRFETTEWSLVLAARERDGQAFEGALAVLCHRYWYPLYAFIRRQGHPADEAEDLTQGFFARLLEKDVLAQVERERGRFRSFLLAACRHYLANERDRRAAQKRGGGTTPLSLDLSEADARYRAEPSHDLTPEREYLRHWALAVLEHALAALRAEHVARGQSALFDALRDSLVGDDPPDGYAHVAQALSMSPGAVRVAAHRLRRRFRRRLVEEVAGTLEDPRQQDEELRALLAVL